MEWQAWARYGRRGKPVLGESSIGTVRQACCGMVLLGEPSWGGAGSGTAGMERCVLVSRGGAWQR